MSEMQPYKERSFRFVELLSIHDWRMKLYGIAWQGELPRPELLEAAKCIAAETLAKETANNYKVGFVSALFFFGMAVSRAEERPPPR